MVSDNTPDPQGSPAPEGGGLPNDLPKALQKVDLDLDDAPFLEDEPEEAPPAAEEQQPAAASVEPEKPKLSKKKKRIIIITLGTVLVIAALIIFSLVRKPKEDAKLKLEETPPEQPAEQLPPEPEPLPSLPPEPPQSKQEIVMGMEPFLVELTDKAGRTRFLTIRFSAATTEPAAELEFKRNTVVVRDAVYYYLKNKHFEFLTDKNNTDALKKDVLSVINQFVGAQPLDNLLIEDYLVK